jgi:hypothetical protein
MALKYGEVLKFVRKHGDVAVVAHKGAKITLLKNGETDSVALVEEDATQFKHEDKSYTRKEFEKLVRASEAAK